jgi:dTDP-glucose 4,6-dehydratase
LDDDDESAGGVIRRKREAMRVVVTGGAGFVGSHMCDVLVGRGDEVVCIDNLLTGARRNIAHLESADAFEFVETDVCEPFDVAGPVDAVMHLASPASPRDYLEHPIATLRVGSDGTFNSLDLARAKGARYLLASTSEVYGDPDVHPQPETYWGNVNPNGPRSVYDEAKRFAEAATASYRREFDTDTTIVRYFNTYGPRMRPEDGRVVSNFIVQAIQGVPITIYGDGSQTRSFGYVDDTVRGTIALLDSDHPGPVNIGNPGEFTMIELAELVLELTGSTSELTYEPLPADDPTQRRPDIAVAGRVLGWSPAVSLREGLVPTIEYFRERVLGG